MEEGNDALDALACIRLDNLNQAKIPSLKPLLQELVLLNYPTPERTRCWEPKYAICKVHIEAGDWQPLCTALIF